MQGTASIITLSSNSPKPDLDQHSHHCIGKQPDTTKNYPTLPLKLDPKFVVPPPIIFGDQNNAEQLHNWAKQIISRSYKITPVPKQRVHELLKFVKRYTINSTDAQKTQQGILYSTILTLDSLTHLHYKSNLLIA